MTVMRGLSPSVPARTQHFQEGLDPQALQLYCLRQVCYLAKVVSTMADRLVSKFMRSQSLRRQACCIPSCSENKIQALSRQEDAHLDVAPDSLDLATRS
jgi:hypothetical protein